MLPTSDALPPCPRSSCRGRAEGVGRAEARAGALALPVLLEQVERPPSTVDEDATQLARGARNRHGVRRRAVRCHGRTHADDQGVMTIATPNLQLFILGTSPG